MPEQLLLFRRARAALGAGTLAILVNTGLLLAADRAGVVTARGGLLTLLNRTLHVPGDALSTNWAFQQGFHIAVGIGMAMFYAMSIKDPRRHVVARSLLYALVVWLANSFVVLPLIGQGLAGARILAPVGIACFAVAHTVFFLLNGVLLARFLAD